MCLLLLFMVFVFHHGNSKMFFHQIWNLTSMLGFQSKGENPSIYLKLSNYAKKMIQTMMILLLGAIIVTFQMMNHHIPRDQLTNYVKKRIQTMIFILDARPQMMNLHILRELIATKHNSQLSPQRLQVVL